jgi:hypothetical protein
VGQIVINLANISGGVIGALNVGGVQAIQSIDVTVGQLLQNAETQDIAQGLKALTEAITDQSQPLSDTQRSDLLEQVEVLGQQATAATEKRKRGIIKSIFDSLANACAGAGGLAVVWQTWGPAISKFFGL